MKKFLFLALGVAGVQLLNPRVLAQLAEDSTDFNGVIAATCAFDGLDSSYAMNYYANSNYLRGVADFNVVTNVAALRFGVSAVTTNSEPIASNGRTVKVFADFFRVDGNSVTLLARGNKDGSGQSQDVDMSQGLNFRISSFVVTNDPIGGRYQLSEGDYSYSVTISCLLP